MKLTITKLIFGSLLVTACGSLDSDQTLQIQMYGSSTVATGATGDGEPDELVYQLTEVSLISTDGATLSTLFANEEEKIFRIIDRAQVIYSTTISDLVGTSYSGLRITFASAVTGSNEKYKDLSFTMAQPTLILTETIAIEKARSLVFNSKANWGDTITDGQITEPTYEFTKE